MAARACRLGAAIAFPIGTAPRADEVRKYIDVDNKLWTEVIKRAHISVE